LRARKPRIDPRNPEAVGQCDRGAHVVLRKDLKKEMVWRGDQLVWNGLLNCERHLDKPHPQDRSRRLPPDPVPVKDPRPEK
jgi:hypothetical protein